VFDPPKPKNKQTNKQTNNNSIEYNNQVALCTVGWSFPSHQFTLTLHPPTSFYGNFEGAILDILTHFTPTGLVFFIFF